MKGQRRDGLWAKALADSDGSEDRAKAVYIKYRVQSIKDEYKIAALAGEAESAAAREHRIKTAISALNACGCTVKELRNSWKIFIPPGFTAQANTVDKLRRYTDHISRIDTCTKALRECGFIVRQIGKEFEVGDMRKFISAFAKSFATVDRTSDPAQTELSLYCVFVDEGVQAVAFHAQRAPDARRLEFAGLEQAADGVRAHGEQAPAEVWGVGARLAQRLARLGINSTLDLRRAPCAVRRAPTRAVPLTALHHAPG